MIRHKEEIFLQTAPNKLELKKGGGCIGCFGFPFFLAGLFMLAIGLRLIPVSNAAEIPWWGWLVVLGMGFIFTAVGATMLFGRKWIMLDVAKGQIWIAQGLLKPMRGSTYNLKDYRSVWLKYIKGDSDTADSYEIVLKGLNEGEISLLSTQDYGTAHAETLKLSSFLKLPGEDRTSDHPVLFKPQEINQEQNEPVFTRKIKQFTAPPNLKSEITDTGTELTISIPNNRYSPINLLELIIPLVIASVFLSKVLPFFRQTGTPVEVQMGFGGFIGLFFFIIPIISVIKRYLASTAYFLVAKVTARSISLKWKKETKIIEKDRIIVVDYGTVETALQDIPYIPVWVGRLQRFARSKGVIIKSKDGVFYIGAGLADDEVVYLYSIIKKRMTLEE